MQVQYTREGEWSGYTVQRTGQGWTVDFWSRIAGSTTGDRWLIPAEAYDIVDLAARWNEGLRCGEYLAEVARDVGRCLRRGWEVR